MAALVEAKCALRELIKKKLSQLTAQEMQMQSKIIHEKVVSSEIFKNSNRISIFLSMKDEINTYPVVQSILEMGKQCFIPNCNGTDMIMVPFKSFDEEKTFTKSHFGVSQPAKFEPDQDANKSGGIDLMFMPGLGFSKEGHRLGRGKGYYDKYLELCSNTGKMPKTIALIFKEQLLDHIPTGEHDMSVDFLFYPTEKEVEAMKKA
ncbi:hypothetical protein EGW08_003178 [Elysia chlorotica]|uniref:5-formyltetrahydrofolate cyclo-ligase n=1 Tax=Elysia chlorotica TaxID=188477 RepID=A0A433U5G9_ELYCH|nr:hypothetical protein EGW08_003178 [Elysia chlorotica]